MTKFHYLLLGYGLIWAVLGVYMITLGRRMQRLMESLDEMRRRPPSGRPPVER